MDETRHLKSGDVSIAYRVRGEGEPTLIYVPGAISNMALEDIGPGLGRFWERAARICRSVRFDKRGTGLSDRGTSALSIQDQIPDVEAVRRPAARVCATGPAFTPGRSTRWASGCWGSA